MWKTKKGHKLKPPFVAITKEMTQSKAYKKLRHSSLRAYIHICLKQKKDDDGGKNLKFTYKEASEVMKEETFNKAITQLVELGFLDMKRSGACFGKKNVFAKSERWRKYGTQEFRQGVRKVIRQNPLKLSE